MAAVNSLRAAVVGSGPAGLYTAEALIKQAEIPVSVDVFDRLPTPYGLVRYGVAPDHPSIRSIAQYLQRVLEQPEVRFLGGIELGNDLTRDDLLRCYDAVVYATGATVDRRLGVPGEDLPGSVSATEFVKWYCGHPDVEAERFTLDTEQVAVIGVGNVAVDVARVLARPAEELAGTDVPAQVLDVLRSSKMGEVNVVGRRGPAQAKFTPKELRELGKLDGAGVHVRPDEIAVDEDELAQAQRQARSNVEVLRAWSQREPQGQQRSINMRFWLRPVEIVGADRVEGLRLERTELRDGRVAGTGEYEFWPVGMVVRSVGYRSVPLPGVAFDESSHTVPNEEGRVLAGAGTAGSAGGAVPGEYVSGWLKRGPTGVIGTNKSDAAQTVRSLLADVPALREARPDGGESIDELLAERGIRPVTYDDWLAVEAAEAAHGNSLGRERVKLAGWDGLREAIEAARRGAG